MKRTAYDVPIGKAKATPSATLCLHNPVPPEEKPKSARQVAFALGINPQSVYQFRIRHPESRSWSAEKICNQILKNKDQSAVAKRQGATKKPGQNRPSFGKMKYTED